MATTRNKTTRLVGITGGIGSGKTYVCRMLETMGYPVYNCDEEAHRLMLSDAALRQQLEALIGQSIQAKDGTLRKDLLRQYLHASAENTACINALVHPAVIRDLLHWKKRQTEELAFVESALLFESELYRYVDRSVVIYADEATRIARVRKRNATDDATIRQWMSRQMSDTERQARADLVIDNSTENTPNLAPIFSLFNPKT